MFFVHWALCMDFRVVAVIGSSCFWVRIPPIVKLNPNDGWVLTFYSSSLLDFYHFATFVLWQNSVEWLNSFLPFVTLWVHRKWSALILYIDCIYLRTNLLGFHNISTSLLHEWKPWCFLLQLSVIKCDLFPIILVLITLAQNNQLFAYISRTHGNSTLTTVSNLSQVRNGVRIRVELCRNASVYWVFWHEAEFGRNLKSLRHV